MEWENIPKQLITIINAVASVIVVIKQLQSLKNWKGEKEKKREIYNQLFDGFGRSLTSIGGVDPRDILYRPYVTKASSAVLKLISSYLPSPYKRKIEFVDSIDLKTDSNIISIGGPVSHPLTRIAMGAYNKDGDIENPTVPFVFDLNVRNLDKQKIKDTFDYGTSICYEPNWVIINSETRKLIAKPSIIGDEITTDYCMITVAPNTLCTEFDKRVYKHLIIAGIHGVGGSIFGNIISNFDIIKKIDGQRQGSQYYQAIIRTDTKWTPRGYKAVGEPKLHMVIPFSI